MFTEKQQLEFNQAFIQRVVRSTDGEIERIKNVLENVNDEQATVDWRTNPMRPQQLVASLAWNRQFKLLMSVRLTQLELQDKMLSTGNTFPTEWANIEFEQKESMAKLKTIDVGKTRSMLDDITDCLLGPKQDFFAARMTIKGKKRMARSPREMKPKKVSTQKMYLKTCFHDHFLRKEWSAR